jgi:hypothetical protein
VGLQVFHVSRALGSLGSAGNTTGFRPRSSLYLYAYGSYHWPFGAKERMNFYLFRDDSSEDVFAFSGDQLGKNLPPVTPHTDWIFMAAIDTLRSPIRGISMTSSTHAIIAKRMDTTSSRVNCSSP